MLVCTYICRRTALQVLVCLCQEGVGDKEVRPLLQFLAHFTEKECDSAEEVRREGGGHAWMDCMYIPSVCIVKSNT